MDAIKTKVKAIIFDMDGTIIKTEHVWQKVTADLLAKYGITDLSDDELLFIESLAGVNLKKAAEIIKGEFGLEDPVDLIYQYKLMQANLYFGDKMDFIEGFELFHQKITQAQIPSGIATNAIPENLREIVKTMNFEQYFGTNIFSIEHVSKPKPDPAMFLHAADSLGAKPEECIVFEDSIHGFNAAKAAGMRCIAIKQPYNKDALQHAHDSIDNYTQAEEALKRL